MNFQAVKVLALKEFRDLVRDPRIFVPFVLSALILPVIGMAVTYATRAAIQQAIAAPRIAVVDLDGSSSSRELVHWLSVRGVQVVELNGVEIEDLVKRASESEASLLLVIEPGFGEALKVGHKPSISLVRIVKELSVFALESAGVEGYVREFIVRKLLEGKVDYELIKEPLIVNSTVYVAAKGVMLGRPELLTGLSMATMLVPLILLSVAMVIMQMAATSMAVENEERTLETLLTLPVSSYDILLSKLLGMFAVSLLGTALEVIGMVAYFYLILTAPLAAAEVQGQILRIELMVTPADMVFLALSLLISLFFAAALGLIVGVLSKDVRIANTVVGPLSMLFYVPALIVLFAPSQALGRGGMALLYTLPVTQPIVAAKDVIGARLPSEFPLYLLASLALTLAIVYIVSKLFSLETISMLQYRISSLIARKVARGVGAEQV